MEGTKIHQETRYLLPDVPTSAPTLTSLTSSRPFLESSHPSRRPQFGPSLPFPNPRPLLFSSVTVSLPSNPPPTRLRIPAAVIFLSSSSAGDPRIATSNRLFPCPFVGSTDLQYCDCESPAFFTRLHHSIASDPAAPRHLRFPPPSQLISPSPIRSLRPAEPRVQSRLSRIESNSTQQQLTVTPTQLPQQLVPNTRQLSAAGFAQTLGVTAFLINHSILPANCRVETDQRHRSQRRRCVIRSATLSVVDQPDLPTPKAAPKTPPSSQTRSPLTPESLRRNLQYSISNSAKQQQVLNHQSVSNYQPPLRLTSPHGEPNTLFKPPFRSMHQPRLLSTLTTETAGI
ncbi:hypothetical protein CNYM01_00194 [Colletotrichum nymphaeae SA-01]|uniref:Uncharacterized protein n=1 Tax=Colletotrichum nymphaeae SA-01 TaxID=1460502 RepID=A0A135U7H8_9PEZI|nr:hypothetical protein CNYM01_00194 [Colletotrichum nymphaeae SA-01]